jgi:glycosyltransferase involved in cell wall biosynthesis
MTDADTAGRLADLARRIDRRVSGGPAAARRLWQAWWEGSRDRNTLATIRDGRDVCWASADAVDPLVTIRIATHDRPRLLVERAIPSALAQTYPNLEILVVGDGATPETATAVRAVGDRRVRFVNLPRAHYPSDPEQRWMVLGCEPINHALSIARGAWIAPLDDDDEFTTDHVEVLLRAAITRHLEFVYGDTAVLRHDGTWGLVGDWPPRLAGFTQGAVLYAAPLRFLRYDSRSYRYGEPADWNLWRRMMAAGVRMGYVSHIVYRYYPASHVPESRNAAVI